jgi:hypothetical protein
VVYVRVGSPLEASVWILFPGFNLLWLGDQVMSHDDETMDEYIHQGLVQMVCSVNIGVHEEAHGRMDGKAKRANKAIKEFIRLSTCDKRLISCEGIANNSCPVNGWMANACVM